MLPLLTVMVHLPMSACTCEAVARLLRVLAAWRPNCEGTSAVPTGSMSPARRARISRSAPPARDVVDLGPKHYPRRFPASKRLRRPRRCRRAHAHVAARIPRFRAPVHVRTSRPSSSKSRGARAVGIEEPIARGFRLPRSGHPRPVVVDRGPGHDPRRGRSRRTARGRSTWTLPENHAARSA